MTTVQRPPTDMSAADTGAGGPVDAYAYAYGPRTMYERESPIHAVFERQAHATPDAQAVVDRFGSVCYAQLDRCANRLARYLGSIGVTPGMAVGVAFERSRDLPVAFLAILKAGCVYVPLDASYPAERIGFILADANISVVITERAALADQRYGTARRVDLAADAPAIAAHIDRPIAAEATSESLAYIMYTSGSTGRAKGVAVTHRGVVRLVRGVDYFTRGQGETILAFAPAAFDASTFEMWGALLNGGRLAIPRAGLLSIAELGAVVTEFAVTTMWLTASIFQRLVEAELPNFGALRQLLTGGSAGSPQHMVRFLALYPACRLIAGYGPTENTTFSTTYHLASAQAIGSNPPIGRPIANSSALVLDEARVPVALGAVGELFVGGDGVAHGYLNLPAETAARFIADPFSDDPSARLYRTGDRVRMRVDGVIEFLGRTDDQVKINGFRIELGEIEATLRAHRWVRDAAVVVVEREAGEKMLSAHVVAVAGTSVDEPLLRAHLREKLPAYMVPPRIALVAELPVHPSGKIDRVALAAAAVSASPTASAPATAAGSVPRQAGLSGPLLTRKIAQIWREVLSTDQTPDVHANFFDAGGDSLRLLRLQQLLSERLATNVSVLDLFEHTTITRMSDFISAEQRR